MMIVTVITCSSKWWALSWMHVLITCQLRYFLTGWHTISMIHALLRRFGCQAFFIIAASNDWSQVAPSTTWLIMPSHGLSIEAEAVALVIGCKPDFVPKKPSKHSATAQHRQCLTMCLTCMCYLLCLRPKLVGWRCLQRPHHLAMSDKAMCSLQSAHQMQHVSTGMYSLRCCAAILSQNAAVCLGA